MFRLMFSFLAIITFSSFVFTQASAPEFDGYSVAKIFRGSPAKIRLITRQDRLFRTKIKEAANKKVNFAGQYILTKWGCGSGCSTVVAIDAKTGRVYWFPRDFSAMGIEYRINSRLVKIPGEMADASNYFSHFFEFVNGKFVFIKTVKLPFSNSIEK